jgi:hypothetical protein
MPASATSPAEVRRAAPAGLRDLARLLESAPYMADPAGPSERPAEPELARPQRYPSAIGVDPDRRGAAAEPDEAHADWAAHFPSTSPERLSRAGSGEAPWQASQPAADRGLAIPTNVAPVERLARLAGSADRPDRPVWPAAVDADRAALVTDRERPTAGDTLEPRAPPAPSAAQALGAQSDSPLALDELNRLGRELIAGIAGAAVPADTADNEWYTPAPAGQPTTSAARWLRLLSDLPVHAARYDSALPEVALADDTRATWPEAGPQSAARSGQAAPVAGARIEPAASAPTPHGLAATAAIDMHEILETLAYELEREYRRFYGP